jgi:hypothetical protein
MNNGKNMQILGAIAGLAATERQLREVKGLVDRSLESAQRFWFVLPLVAAGWMFMVSDDERFALLEQAADQLLDRFPVLEPLERLITA